MSMPLLARTGQPSREKSCQSKRRSPVSRLAERSGSMAAANAIIGNSGTSRKPMR
jgi:hypothetical protein